MPANPRRSPRLSSRAGLIWKNKRENAAGVLPEQSAAWRRRPEAELSREVHNKSIIVAMNTYIRRSIFVVILLSGCERCPVQNPGGSQTTVMVDPAAVRIDEDRSGCVVGRVPVDYSLDPFYEKYCDADGISIISSGNVDDLALQQAYSLIINMLAPIPKVHQELISNGAYIGIIGKNEELTTLPEYAHLDSEFWDQRARGLGGSLDQPITSCDEENLLCFPWDGYYGESILVHEFAHTIGLMGLGDNFEPLLDDFSGVYDSAIQQGLWQNTYAGSNLVRACHPLSSSC